VVNVTFWLKGKRINSTMGVADRSNLRNPVIIGRQDLIGFIVDPVFDEE